MAETIALAAPIQAKSGTSTLNLASLVINAEASFIEAHFRGTNGELEIVRWDNARDIILALNKANLTTKSLERRVMERAINDGKIPAATISGTPD
jgi:hypothetical protein